MSAIDEMYEKYGVKKKRECEFYDDCPFCLSHFCKDCDINSKEIYSSFTAGKQLELIKILLKNVNIKLNPFIEYELNSDDRWRYIHTNLTFAEALAEIITNYSTILDNQKVKEILER